MILPAFCLAWQDTTNTISDTTKPKGPWKHAVVAGFTMTQVAFQDWSQGGENALSYAITVNGKTQRDGAVTNWTNSYKMTFGQTRLGGQGLRKTDDKIDLESVLTYKIKSAVSPYASATLKTQFATGFTFDEDTGARTAVSGFFDPAYLTQVAGFEYKPSARFRTRLGAGLREVVTSLYTSYADDPNTATIEKVMVDGGFESVTNIDLELDDNLVLTSKVELFAAFKALDEIIVRSDNTIAAKVSKYISVILNVQLVNDRKVTPRTQVKETLSLGLSYTLI